MKAHEEYQARIDALLADRRDLRRNLIERRNSLDSKIAGVEEEIRILNEKRQIRILNEKRQNI